MSESEHTARTILEELRAELEHCAGHDVPPPLDELDELAAAARQLEGPGSRRTAALLASVAVMAELADQQTGPARAVLFGDAVQLITMLSAAVEIAAEAAA